MVKYYRDKKVVGVFVRFRAPLQIDYIKMDCHNNDKINLLLLLLTLPILVGCTTTQSVSEKKKPEKCPLFGKQLLSIS
jgi:hypothetical protein